MAASFGEEHGETRGKAHSHLSCFPFPPYEHPRVRVAADRQNGDLYAHFVPRSGAHAMRGSKAFKNVIRRDEWNKKG